MIKYLFAIIFLILISSCSDVQQEQLKQTREDYEFTMKVVIVETPEKILKVCKDLGVQYDANGCAAFDLIDKHCTIYVLPQRYTHDDERLALIGHETWHCVYGRWHD